MGKIEREKVIKGLEVCLRNIDQQDCPNDCPYLSDCSKYENRVVFQPLMRDALALLKEQGPMRVISQRVCKTIPNHYERIGLCPNCNHIMELYRNRSYCGFCGQEVKWK